MDGSPSGMFEKACRRLSHQHQSLVLRGLPDIEPFLLAPAICCKRNSPNDVLARRERSAELCNGMVL